MAVEGLLRWLRKRPEERPFEALQIEVTSRCNLKCVMCPVTVLAATWPARDMAWETFERIAAAFSLSKWVYLQGWGEPLLHRRIFDMADRAKAAGCLVGFTTNGTRLSRQTGDKLLDHRLDLLAVSIAGACPCTHESIRTGSDFARLIGNLRRFIRQRNERGSVSPKVEILFLMTRTNLAELPQAVELAADVGADELVATNLDYVMTPALDALRTFDSVSPDPVLARPMEQAHAASVRTGIAFRPYPLQTREMAVCDLNPLKILFVSADGSVSPCVYTSLTEQPEIPRVFNGERIGVPSVRFGNVNQKPIPEIWEGADYRAFRERFAIRLRCARNTVLGALAGNGLPDDDPPAPEPCRTCPKLYGV